MMHDDSEDKIFKELLADFSEPVEDDGFSKSVIDTFEHEANRVARLRTRVIGAAGTVGGLIALTKLPAVLSYFPDVSVPKATLPDSSAITSTLGTQLGSSITMQAVVGMGVVFLVWAGSSLLFSEEL